MLSRWPLIEAPLSGAATQSNWYLSITQVGGDHSRPSPLLFAAMRTHARLETDGEGRSVAIGAEPRAAIGIVPDRAGTDPARLAADAGVRIPNLP